MVLTPWFGFLLVIIIKRPHTHYVNFYTLIAGSSFQPATYAISGDGTNVNGDAKKLQNGQPDKL